MADKVDKNTSELESSDYLDTLSQADLKNIILKYRADTIFSINFNTACYLMIANDVLEKGKFFPMDCVIKKHYDKALKEIALAEEIASSKIFKEKIKVI